jgi:hypothetical protein
MSRPWLEMPNQVDGEHFGLLEADRLLALAAEYEVL